MYATVVLLAVPLVAAYLLASLWHRRFRQFAHFPQIQPSLVWGHLRAIHEYGLRNPPKMHHDQAFAEIHRQLGSPPLMLFDLRPVSYPMLLVSSHDVAEQISRASKMFPWSTPKSPTVLNQLVRLTGAESILTKESEDWKQLRKRFNPGFAPQHLMTLLPCILDKTSIFLEHLEQQASAGTEVPLSKLTINLTFDIIGAVTMDVDFGAQNPHSSGQGAQFIRLYEQLLSLYGGEDSQYPWWVFPRREWRRYWLARQIDGRLEDMIRQKHAEQQQQQRSGKARARDVLSLSLQDNPGELSAALVAETRDQLKTFLFAGHDTTSILLTWIFYELGRTPAALKAVRGELDELFGPDPDPAAVRAKLLAPGGEELIHRMTYASAVIKEALRLYPPAATGRMAPPGSNCVVRTSDGQSYCIDGMILYNCATIIQRDRAVFGDTANDFVPERWLGDKSGIMSDPDVDDSVAAAAGGRKYPPGAWRPFERGPRHCIGQDFATIEARVIIAVVARRFDFVKVGLGELDLDAQGRPTLNEKGQYRTKSDMYSTQQVTAKPVDGMRMKVKLRA